MELFFFFSITSLLGRETDDGAGIRNTDDLKNKK